MLPSLDCCSTLPSCCENASLCSWSVRTFLFCDSSVSFKLIWRLGEHGLGCPCLYFTLSQKGSICWYTCCMIGRVCSSDPCCAGHAIGYCDSFEIELACGNLSAQNSFVSLSLQCTTACLPSTGKCHSPRSLLVAFRLQSSFWLWKILFLTSFYGCCGSSLVSIASGQAWLSSWHNMIKWKWPSA